MLSTAIIVICGNPVFYTRKWRWLQICNEPIGWDRGRSFIQGLITLIRNIEPGKISISQKCRYLISDGQSKSWLATLLVAITLRSLLSRIFRWTLYPDNKKKFLIIVLARRTRKHAVNQETKAYSNMVYVQRSPWWGIKFVGSSRSSLWVLWEWRWREFYRNAWHKHYGLLCVQQSSLQSSWMVKQDDSYHYSSISGAKI